MSPPRIILLVCLGAVGCGDDTPAKSQIAFDPTLADTGDQAADWLAFPFPSDHRRNDDGTADFSDFPNPERDRTVAEYRRAASALKGFGTTAPAFFHFETPLDTGGLSTEIDAGRGVDDALQIVDVTEGGDGYGERYPVRWEYFERASLFMPAGTLAVGPAWGAPLRPGATYAVLLRRGLRDAKGNRLVAPPLLRHLLGTGGERAALEAKFGTALVGRLREIYRPLRTALERDGPPPDDVAVATVFSTYDVPGDLDAIYAYLRDTAPAPTPVVDGWQTPELQSFTWNQAGDTANYWVIEGSYDAPNFQQGNPPYSGRGDGGFVFDSAGVPVVQRTERLRFVLTVPEAAPPDGADCYPIVEYAHGTYGSAGGFVATTGGRLAARGLAAIGIDQPLHGPRYTEDPTLQALYSFNFLNPVAGRTVFRQSAVDTFSLTRMLAAGFEVPAAASPTGSRICFDPARIFFFGHSQGGLSGAIAAGFEQSIAAWVLSGAGTGLSVTLVEREDPEFTAVRELFLEGDVLAGDSQPLTENHAVAALVQTLAEPIDPGNYAHRWLDGTRSILMTSGRDDTDTPHRTAEALALSGGLPLLEPVFTPIASYDAWGTIESTPAVANIGPQSTAGFIQWGADGTGGTNQSSHFVIFYRREAIHASMAFLESAAFSPPARIERDPTATVR